MIAIARCAAAVLFLAGCATVAPPQQRSAKATPTPPAPVASAPAPVATPPAVFAAPPPPPLAATPLPPLPSQASAAPAAPGPSAGMRTGMVESLISEQSASAGSSASRSAAPPYRLTVGMDDGSTQTFREFSLRFRSGDRVGVLPNGTVVPLRPPPEASAAK